ncbi:hypothetical protein WA171_007040 [Blastocystis sp. BT1]
MLSRTFMKIVKPAFFARSFASEEFKLPPLPYSKKDLEPVISEKTLTCHYNGHHQTYVNNLNAFTKDTDRKSLEYYITEVSGPIHNQAAQIWNHTFFWNCMTPKSEQPSGVLLDRINKDFGSFAQFQTAFTTSAVGLFGSGWTWLVYDGKENKLKVMNTSNEVNPMQNGLRPLLTLDVWEHSYYLDYQFRRADYVKNWWKIVNWNFVAKEFEKCK